MDAPLSALGPWDPLPVGDTVELMGGFRGRWWIAGGHALELHLGRAWRTHDDTDVGICRKDVPLLHSALSDWEVFVASKGELAPWRGQPLSSEAHQSNLWCRPPGGPWRLDVTVGEGDDERWIYRRDRSLALPWHRAVLSTAAGVPYLAPALQLLFKSKDVRPKDQIDAEVVIPELDPASLALLDVRLPRDHPWVELVASHRRGATAADVVELLDRIEAAGVDVWVDGGWGVDAVLGEQTRSHADLDIAVPTRQFSLVRAVLAGASFVLVRDDGPYNVVLGDQTGRLVDVHTFDDSTTVVGPDGVERYGPDGLAYEVDGFGGDGSIAGRPVRCMTAEFQMRSHTGYPLDDDDWHDVSNLHRRFGLAIPADYDRWRSGRD